MILVQDSLLIAAGTVFQGTELGNTVQSSGLICI